MPLTAFFAHASRMFEIDAWDPETKSIGWTKGGFQGARGGPGSDWFISHVLEELDAPTEYYYSPSAKVLYYFHDAQCHSWEAFFGKIISFYLLLAVISGFWWSY